jgi:phage-related protein
MAAVIIFNGAALEDVAPVMVEDIRVSPIQLSATARERPINWGSDFVRLVGGDRTVAITFALLTRDIGERQEQLKQITRWARTDRPGKLHLSWREGYYLECLCTGLPEPSTRQWWESKLRLTFTTFDNPFWTSDAEKTAACGTQFTVLGDAPPLMRITNTAAEAATAQAYSDGSSTMTFAQVPAGDLVIDLNRQTAAVDGASIMGGYAFGSHFIRPRTGAQTITGAGQVVWRERWE